MLLLPQDLKITPMIRCKSNIVLDYRTLQPIFMRVIDMQGRNEEKMRENEIMKAKCNVKEDKAS